MKTPPTDCDILIVGAGPVGATLGALLLADGTVAPGRVILLDAHLPDLARPLSGLPLDLRVFALSRASERILRACGAWEGMRAAGVGPYERMVVWSGADDPRGDAALVFDAAEQAQPDLGHIVPNNLLQQALLQRFVALGGRLEHGSLAALDFLSDRIVARCAANDRSLSAHLLVGADGAHSPVRQLAGIRAVAGSYQQAAIVANVATGRPHERTAWQRFLGNGTLALLPLASGECSIVWSLPAAEAAAVMQLAPREFTARLAADSAGVLGDLSLQSQRASLSLQRQSVDSYVRERCALAGDAAHVVHPLAGQGVNLGLLDAAALADTLADARRSGEDFGALRVLRNYERWRRSENGLMTQAIDAFNRFLATGTDSWSQLARRGMRVVGDNALLRRWFAERALGTEGDLPRAARTLR